MKLTRLLMIMAIAAGGVYTYDRYRIISPQHPPEDAASGRSPAESQFDRPWGQPPGASQAQAGSSAFRCDGRTHCSQMRSCAEATFFIRHCPNTRMDGDQDGIPCEKQWCN